MASTETSLLSEAVVVKDFPKLRSSCEKRQEVRCGLAEVRVLCFHETNVLPQVVMYLRGNF